MPAVGLKSCMNASVFLASGRIVFWGRGYVLVQWPMATGRWPLGIGLWSLGLSLRL